MQYINFNPAFRVPEIIVFENANFEGRSFRTNNLIINDVAILTHVFIPVGVNTQVQNFANSVHAHSDLISLSWNMNDKISSIVVISGIWQFYRHINLKEKIGPLLKPGYYPWVVDIGIQNDHISSFECIEQTSL